MLVRSFLGGREGGRAGEEADHAGRADGANDAGERAAAAPRRGEGAEPRADSRRGHACRARDADGREGPMRWGPSVKAVSKDVHLIHFVKSFPTNIWLRKSALIQPRTSLSKIAHFSSCGCFALHISIQYAYIQDTNMKHRLIREKKKQCRMRKTIHGGLRRDG